METITKTRLSVKVSALGELLDGAMTCAGKGKDTPSVLNTIALHVAGEELIARATDRYRLIEGRVTLDDTGEFSPVLISLADVKRIIELMKGISVGYVIIERDYLNQRVSVRVNANSELILSPVEGNFPTDESTDRLLVEPENFQPVSEISFNPKFMADFGKISKRITVKFNGNNKPIHIKLDGDLVTWRALLMPVKSA